MKKNFNLDDLENFLSESTEQHRMYPSDRVWRNIDKELHGSKHWPALTFGAILTGAVITAGLILIHPDKNLFTVNLPVSNHTEKIVSAPVASNQSSSLNIPAPGKTILLTEDHGLKNIEPEALQQEITVDAGSKIPAPGFENRYAFTQANSAIGEFNADESKLSAENDLNSSDDEPGNSHRKYIVASEDILKSSSSAEDASNTLKDIQAEDDANPRQLPASIFRMDEAFEHTSLAASGAIAVDKNGKNKPGRWSFIFYATPSISYRYLSEAKTVDLHLLNGPVAPNLTHGVNDFVRHKPIAGFEIGSGIIYNLTPSIRLRTGLQFNLRGYSIEAYASKRETSTIVLNRGFYTDSLVAVSSIGTQNGYWPKQITNRYLEISVPVAMDMRLADWKKIQLYVAAGIQPTYQFNQSMYMISSDYKKYIQEPDLVRHWNMNTTLEAYINYKAAGVTWQLGPQIRYQVLPGAINQYPVRERLIDYGLKIGVVKTLK